MDFWPQFCSKAGVFCIGEVFGGLEIEDVRCLPESPSRLKLTSSILSPIAQYQGPQALDSVLNFPMYSALMESFAIPGPRNVSALADVIEQSKIKFKVFLSLPGYSTESSHTHLLSRILACSAISSRIKISHVGTTYLLILRVYSKHFTPKR